MDRVGDSRVWGTLTRDETVNCAAMDHGAFIPGKIESIIPDWESVMPPTHISKLRGRALLAQTYVILNMYSKTTNSI